MNKPIYFLPLISGLLLGATLAHAEPQVHGGEMHTMDKCEGAMHGQMKGHAKGQMIKQMDANRDGDISKAEFDAFHGSRFKKLDSNSDGKISTDEINSARKNTGHGSKENYHHGSGDME